MAGETQREWGVPIGCRLRSRRGSTRFVGFVGAGRLSHRIHFLPRGYTVTVQVGETVLEALHRLGYTAPHACRNGKLPCVRCSRVERPSGDFLT